MRSRYKFLENKGPYFITLTIVEWLPIFVNRRYFEIIYDSLKYYSKKGTFQVLAYVVLENHLHLIIVGKDLSRGMRAFKSYTAKEIITRLKADGKKWALNQLAYYKKRHKIQSSYQVWQEGVHPQLISSEEMLIQKIEYIHLNPVRRGYVKRVEDWLWSSADCFSKGGGLSKLEL